MPKGVARSPTEFVWAAFCCSFRLGRSGTGRCFMKHVAAATAAAAAAAAAAAPAAAAAADEQIG